MDTSMGGRALRTAVSALATISAASLSAAGAIDAVIGKLRTAAGLCAAAVLREKGALPWEGAAWLRLRALHLWAKDGAASGRFGPIKAL
jgi:hypothetical protein